MVAFSKIELKWVWVSDVHVYIKSDAVYLILTMLSCENPSNIWEFNYLPPMCGASEIAGKMELVLLLNEWISLFSHGTFQRYVFMLSVRFVRTSGNNFNCLTKHGAILFSLNISRPRVLTARVLMNMLAIRYFFPNAGNWRIDLWNR